MPLPLIVIAVAVIAVAILGAILMPHPKKPDALTDLDNPVAEAGKPIPVVFGTITVKGLNVLWFGDKWRESYKSDGGGGK